MFRDMLLNASRLDAAMRYPAVACERVAAAMKLVATTHVDDVDVYVKAAAQMPRWYQFHSHVTAGRRPCDLSNRPARLPSSYG